MSSGSDWVLVDTGLGLAVAAFVLSWLFCAVARRYAPRLGFLDRPGGHKGHRRPTPLGGGVAIWLTTVIVLGACGLAVLMGGPELPGRWPSMSLPAGSSAGPASCSRSSPWPR